MRELIIDCREHGPSDELYQVIRGMSRSLWPRGDTIVSWEDVGTLALISLLERLPTVDVEDSGLFSYVFMMCRYASMELARGHAIEMRRRKDYWRTGGVRCDAPDPHGPRKKKGVRRNKWTPR